MTEWNKSSSTVCLIGYENCVETARRGQEPRIRSLGPPAANESSSSPLIPPLTCSSNVSFILFFFTRSHMAGHNRPFVYTFEHVASPRYFCLEEIGEERRTTSRNNPSIIRFFFFFFRKSDFTGNDKFHGKVVG